MPHATITINLRMRWWVRPYLYMVVALARLGLIRPDLDRVARFVSHKGFRITST